MSLTLASIGSVFDRAIVDTGRLPAFLFFCAFLVSWGFIRTSAHMIRAQVSWWPGNVQVGGTHIHHLVWGILILLVFGWIGVVYQPESPWHEIVAILFGVGTGLTLDEFALWLELKDVYWQRDGRRSVDAVAVAAALCGIALVGFAAWVDVADSVESAVFAVVGFVGVLGLVAGLINAAKEKFGMAVLSLIVPLLGLIGVLRLGRPRSLWARLFYREHLPWGARQLARSRARYPEAGASAEAPPRGGLGSGASGEDAPASS